MSFWSERFDQRLMLQPRLAIWVGSDYVSDRELESDLGRLGINLRAIYLDTPDTRFERTLEQAVSSARSRLATILDEADAEIWQPDDLGVFYIRGNDPEEVRSDREIQRRSFAMSATLRRLAAAEPALVIVVMGVTSPEAAEFLADDAPAVPAIFLGDAAVAGQILERQGMPEDRLRVYGRWAEFREELGRSGISLFPKIEDLGIQAGHYRVSLSEVFSDPYLRIDDHWRIISTAAMRSPGPEESLTQLFESYLEGDERYLASRVEDDTTEWQALNAGLPFERHAQKEVTEAILSELHRLERNETNYRRPRVCWLPAEPASGLTRMLHSAALSAAKAGYPTLILKQTARTLDQDRTKDFLQALHEIALRMATEAEDEKYRERPVLLVLDADHAGVSEIEALLDLLVRRHGRTVLTLWGVAVEVGTPLPGQSAPHEHYRARFRRLLSRYPQVADRYLPILRSGIEPDELNAFAAHCDRLRTERHLDLPARDEDTWRLLQDAERRYVQNLIARLPVSRDEKQEAGEKFEREIDLFWVCIQHFLTSRHADPIADALGRRVERLFENLDRRQEEANDAVVTGVTLIQIAKAWVWGLDIPETALVDWIKRWRCEPKPRSVEHAHMPSESVVRMEERLREWASGRALTIKDPGIALPALLNQLETEGWIRQLWTAGANRITFRHHVLARAFLLAAHGRPGLPDELRHVLGRPAEVLDREIGFEGFVAMIELLQPNPANIHFCQVLSEELLLGTDESQYWKDGRGEGRLKAYDGIPARIRDRSRVLRHHRAVVLRRSTFNRRLPEELRRQRLEDAQKEILAALELPWQIGARDEAPAILRTTLALVTGSLIELTDDHKRAAKMRREAEQLLRVALLEKPDSGHTRLALANMLVESAEVASALGMPEQAVASAAEVLDVLSVDPTGRELSWYETKSRAAEMFSDEGGQRLLDDLKRKGIEAAFLLEAETVLASDVGPHQDRLSRAFAVLFDIIGGQKAHKNPRAAYRAATLLREMRPTESAERHRLLRAAESAGVALASRDEFDLAVLTYMAGDYREGDERFTRLRSSGRAEPVAEEKIYFTDAGSAKPIQLRGRIESFEGGRGWMSIFREGQRLFRAPFQGQHFGYDRGAPRPGTTWEEVHVRFTPMGPKAVPQRFFFSSAKSSQEGIT